MANVKYAIRFPDFLTVSHSQATSIFSEASIIKTTGTFLKTLDALGNLTEFVIQRNRTNEQSKQLNAQKLSLDASVENMKEQKRIEFEEYTKRLQAQLKFEKERLELEIKKLVLESSEKVNNFSISFEEHMMSNKVLHNLISAEEHFLESIKDYIDDLANDYARRKEYVVYCEMQRKSLNLVEQYMKEMI